MVYETECLKTIAHKSKERVTILTIILFIRKVSDRQPTQRSALCYLPQVDTLSHR